MSRCLLVVSSGTGPWEVRRFVALLSRALAGELVERGFELEEVVHDGDESEPRSVSLFLLGRRGQAADLVGSHALIARSSRRSRASRHRWFAGVGLHVLRDDTVEVLDPKDVEFRADRSGGPGGQNVNARSTAVRARHRPSGLSVRVTSGRSQHANRRLALQRLSALLEASRADVVRDDRARRRSGHHGIERGRPIRTWQLDRRGRLVALPEAADEG